MMRFVTHSVLASLLFATLVTAAAAGNGQSQGDPRLDYMLQCQGCHLADGRGTPELSIPSMLGLAERFRDDPEARAYLVQVPGVSQAPLDDRAIAELLNWILERFRANDESRDFALYDEKEVTLHRAHKLADVAATRARLIERRLQQNTEAK